MRMLRTILIHHRCKYAHPGYLYIPVNTNKYQLFVTEDPYDEQSFGEN
jgi:hypothetical protein